MACTTATAGADIRDARMRRGWTHADLVLAVRRHPQLGRKYALSPQTVANVEAGRVARPHLHTKFALATVLDLDLFDLWPEA